MAFTLPDRSSFNFPAYLHDALSAQVDGIALVGSFVGTLYHFRVFLFNQTLQCCVRIDCIPSAMDFNDMDKARVDFATKGYMFSIPQGAPTVIPSTTGPFCCVFQTPVQIGTILELLFTHLKRDQYRFSGGMGCRHWCAVILNDLETHGYVPSGATAQFEMWELMKSMELGAYFPVPRVQGTFYD